MTAEIQARISSPATRSNVIVEPYLHVQAETIYNPINDRVYEKNSPGFSKLERLLKDPSGLAELEVEQCNKWLRDGWLIIDDDTRDRRFSLKYVSFEANSNCNQRCYFCPVSEGPRESLVMPMEAYQEIIHKLLPYRDTLEAVFLFIFNEPTLDPLLLERIALLKRCELPIAVNSNATGLTPDLAEKIIELGGLDFLSINLSTLDPAQYREDRGLDHLPVVLKNMDYISNRPLAKIMRIAVLGNQDIIHQQQLARIRKRFMNTRFDVQDYGLVARTGEAASRKAGPNEAQRPVGCDNLGSRLLQHLHINADGSCTICCEDYLGRYLLESLLHQSPRDILTSEKVAQLRRWTYGLEHPPADYICRSCEAALTE
ncbi:radical SAM/SPASM domain-containing protein [Halioglobus maricola]|uniref:Radical SAM/SPASM domain-containing protein n=1 Tax=Halioglobus maricola TaxID=2601894 RepID=A0A5P9NF66_9GAMM|nr:radical SAM/SPASM domain-containing protein [Halioglobus maricola]QFU74411.1 radical SAM/SPASM domain-containing protein [Halioglobus maricola]